MTENHSTRKFAEELTSQDSVVSGFNVKEFTVKLQEELASIERHARSARRACWIACVVAVVWWATARLSFNVLGLMGGDYRFIWAGCGWTAMTVAGVLLVLYRGKYRPALERARIDLQISMIADLQRQIATLNERLDGRAK
jgi:hypothetical protein